MRFLPLSNTHELAIVDPDVQARARQFTWRLDAKGYVVTDVWRNRKRIRIALQQLVVKVPKGKVTDHANRDKLDNRRSNLRPATNGENMANTTKQVNVTSGYRGVQRRADCRTKPWAAAITVNGKHRSLGNHPTREEAARAYDTAAFAAWGEFAVLNFPPK